MAAKLGDVFVRFTGDITDLKKKMSSGELSVAKFGERMGSIGARASLALSLPLLAAGAATGRAAVQMDSLDRGLVAVSGSSAAAHAQLKDLQDVAKLPGLGFRE